MIPHILYLMAARHIQNSQSLFFLKIAGSLAVCLTFTGLPCDSFLVIHQVWANSLPRGTGPTGLLPAHGGASAAASGGAQLLLTFYTPCLGIVYAAFTTKKIL